MYRWILERCCDHKTLELRMINYNTPEVSYTVIDHEIRCSRCGKIIVDRRDFNRVGYLISQV
jgi:hypothetical protein